jgi:hypothetical protein
MASFMAPFEAAGGSAPSLGRLRYRLPAALSLAFVLVGFLPTSADLSTHGPLPAAALSDGSTPVIPLVLGTGPSIAFWMTKSASDALPPPADAKPIAASASAHLWVLPAVPQVTVSANVTVFDTSMTQKIANAMAHDAVLGLVIEAEARRSHSSTLAATGADPGFSYFTDLIKQDAAAGRFVTTTYNFSSASISLFLPKFATQAARLEGLTLVGSATLVTRDRSGNVTAQTTSPYNRSWGMYPDDTGSHFIMYVDYTGLAPAG